MNHTSLWNGSDEQEDDDRLGEDILLQTTNTQEGKKRSSGKSVFGRAKSGNSGSWLLRQSIGKGPSLGEKIGESIERAAYKAVAGAGMSNLLCSLGDELVLTSCFSHVRPCSCAIVVAWNQRYETCGYFHSHGALPRFTADGHCAHKLRP